MTVYEMAEFLHEWVLGEDVYMYRIWDGENNGKTEDFSSADEVQDSEYAERDAGSFDIDSRKYIIEINI